MSGLIGSIVAAILESVLRFFGSRLDKRASDSEHERAGAAEAANETQQAITEVADARASVPDPSTDPDDIARSLRERKAGTGSVNRRRPF